VCKLNRITIIHNIYTYAKIIHARIVPRVANHAMYKDTKTHTHRILSRFFPEWTIWALLVGLAIYDIFAVLTPWGPLKALVELSQERGDAIPVSTATLFV